MNGDIERPVGETAEREIISVEGIEVALKMPVFDSHNSYDILLGRDWLYAVKAVGEYDKNSYKISKGGKEATLRGKVFTRKEVELAADSSSDESSDEEELDSEESEDEDSNDEGIETYLATVVRTSDFDLEAQQLRSIEAETESLKVKFNTEKANLPVRTTKQAAGYDLTAAENVVIKAGDQALVDTGIAIEIPEGHYGQIKPRSGLALKKRITVGAGVIDRDYRGNVRVLLLNQSSSRFIVQAGERIAQLLLVKIATPEVVEVETFEETEHGEKGFGSTGTTSIKAKILTVEELREVDINPNLETERAEAGKELLWEFRELFAKDLSELGHTDLVEHEIHLKPDARPYYYPGTRRFAPVELEAIRASIREEIEARKIIEYDGPWCAPIVLAKKKDGTFRKYVAYNGLNARTERESWPLPNIEELLECMAGHTWYSASDGFSGYYAVRMRPEDVAKTMF